MPWKDGYTISDEKSLADADVRWPEGKRCAVHIDSRVTRTHGQDEAVLAPDHRALAPPPMPVARNTMGKAVRKASP